MRIRNAYKIVFITSLAFFYSYALNNIFNTLAPFLIKNFQVSFATLGFIDSLFFYGYLLFLIPAGFWLDKKSPKRLMPFSSFICASSILLIAYAKTLFFLGLGRFLMGAFAALCFSGCIKVAATLVEERNMAKIMGFLTTIGMLGGLVVQAPLSILMHYFSWRTSLVIVALVGYGISLLIYVALYPVNFTPLNANNSFKPILKILFTIFKNPRNIAYGLYASLMNISFLVLGALFGVPYLMAVLHFSRIEAAVVTSMLFIGAMLGTPCIGWIADRTKSHEKVMLMSALFSSVILYVILFYGHSQTSLSFLFFCLGIGLSAQMLSYPLILKNNPRELSAVSSTVVTFFLLLGGMIIQPSFGLAVEYFSSFIIPGQCLLAFTGLALLVSTFLTFRSRL